MKRVIRILGMACMAGLLVFTACKKENATTTEIEVVMPGMTCADDGERAFINVDWQFCWLAGDQIMVYNLDTVNSATGTTASVSAVYHNTSGQVPRARFTGPSLGKKMAEDYRYFYPVNMIEPNVNAGAQNMAALGMENRQYFYVKPVQQYNNFDAPNHPASRVDVSSMPMSIDTKNLKASATLWQIFGVADVELRAAEGSTIVVNEIRIIDNVYHLWGTCSLRLHEVDTAILNRMLYKEFIPGASAGTEAAMATYNASFASYVIGDLGWESQPGVYPGYTLDPEKDADLQMRTMTMNCIHTDPESGDEVGVTLSTSTTAPSEFCFILRPLALAHGFIVEVDIDGRDEPLIIDTWADNTGWKVGGRVMVPGMYRLFLYETAIQ